MILTLGHRAREKSRIRIYYRLYDLKYRAKDSMRSEQRERERDYKEGLINGVCRN